MLEIGGLRKRYGERVAVDGVDLHIAPGEVCALLGPNGAGKTTLVSAVAGLRRPDEGSVRVNGLSVWPDPKQTKPLIGSRRRSGACTWCCRRGRTLPCSANSRGSVART